MQSTIALHGMEFFAFHGVMEHERKTGNIFIVDVEMDVDISQASISDNLEDTLNYAEVYSLVKQEMEQVSCLLEHVAGRILRKLTEAFPQAENITLSVRKMNPPVGGKTAYAKVSVSSNSGRKNA